MAEPKVSTQAAHVSSGSNLPVTRIVIHATCPMLGFPAASAYGQARSTARYFTNASSGGSAHYIEDAASEEHCVADNSIAWHAPPNRGSVGVEICADGGSAAAYRSKPSANYTREQWLSPQVWPAVKRAAARTRELCDRFGIPKVQLTSAQVRAGRSGICGHINVSEAFGQTDHSDPGPAFPWAEFMKEVTGTTTKPAAPVQEDDMPAPKDLWDYKIVGPDGKFVASAAAYLTYGNAKAGQAARDAGAALAVVKALAAKPAGLTADEIEAAAKAGAKAALEEEIDSATVVLNATKGQP